ncbi:MAG: autotransporter outer membrane beta-barrel domain-containing protein, partial [Leptotrichiaceae bacterium]
PITPVTVTLPLPSTPMTPSGPPTVAMYVDTSGLRYTTPMTSSTGTALATNLQIGTEVTEYTNAKAIKIDDPNIIIPYSTTAWKEVTSSSLTWIASRGLDPVTGTINAFYLAKLPYTDFASDTNVYNFADGLEQRYGVEGLTSREKQLFNRLNSIGNNEQILLYQAYDEMMGHQYSNVQQRLFSTGSSLNKEFDYLSSERATASKQSNKIKIFGMKGEYNTDTAGIIDYTNNTYGVAYLHENETIKLGSNTGWYAGFVQNRFDFKDIGGSEENTTMGKLGIFKTMAFDNNGSLTWKISGEGMFGYSQMDRKFLVVDEIFGAESTYTSYGVALRNEISKDIRLTERTSLKPYGSLAIEYGRFSDIKEKTGEMRLEVEGNDYYSIKPEVGVEYKYKQPLFLRSNLTASLGIAYENDLGKVNDAENRARVGYTDADYFNLRGEKENRTGNGKADLKIGIENSRVGLTLDLGYDTKGENVRGGMGLRIIY